jgi:hypothetical protein
VGLIELRHIYDGWSIEVLGNGTLRNRWEYQQDEYPERFEATQEWINAENAKRLETW